MAVGRTKTWIAGEVLTASDLNAEFNNILNNAADLANPLTKALDMNGNELILDADADTSITADTDDRIDFRVAGTDSVHFGHATGNTGAFVLIDALAFNATANTSIGRLRVGNTNAVTVPSGTTPVVAGIFVEEPNITATGTVTDAATVYIEAAPTEGTDNHALLIASGALTEAKGGDIASATTTDIGSATGNFVDVTGTTTITGLGTVQAGARRIVQFDGALTLTHNGTSLILPGSANITTAAGDVAEFVSLGSGNWICTNYQVAAQLPGGRWDLIGTATASNDATVEFTWAGETYQKVVIVVQNAVPATDGQGINLRTSTDGGSSFDSGASDYRWSLQQITMATSPVETNAGDNADNEILVQSLVGSDTNEFSSCIIEIIGPAQTGFTAVTSRYVNINNTGAGVSGMAGGFRESAADVDGVQLLFASGNVESGEFAAYGLR